MISLRLETFPEIIQALFIYKNDKDLKVKEHVFLLVMSYVVHSVMDFVYLGFVFNYSPIWFADRCFTVYCLYVIVTNSGIPFVDRFINFPVYTPLTDTLYKYLQLVIGKFTKKKTRSTQPDVVPPPTSVPTNNLATTSSFLLYNNNNINQSTRSVFPVNQAPSAQTTSATTNSTDSISSLLFRPHGQAPPQPPITHRPFINLKNHHDPTGLGMINTDLKTTTTNNPLTYQDYPSYDLKRMLQESERLDLQARQQTRMAPSLSFAASIQPPRPPVKRMDKTLWQLSRTDKMEDEFREEQVALLNENWEKVVTSDIRPVFRDRLTKWLSSKVFHPLASGIVELDQQIHPHSMVNCPENIMASIMYFNPKMMILKESIYLPGYSDSLAARQYVAERIKGNNQKEVFVHLKRSFSLSLFFFIDLGSCDNLQSYHWTKQSVDLPGDDVILMHCFKTYMKYEMPNVVPPLIPEEGGIFLFLLVFFFITEELKDQIFHL
ncbi:hypothetical protein BC941DRAFT_504984 [Chlamydoabsidia padenii]|nr:hypothetical protein BC941DRAFT_504984 [Chlamydoabsidia padenii]